MPEVVRDSWREDVGVRTSLQIVGFAALRDPRLSNPTKMRKKCCYGRRRTWGQYSSLSPSPTHLSHTETSTLLKIKCEIYIFIKKCVSSFIEGRILCLIMFPHIFVYVCGYTTREKADTKLELSFLFSVVVLKYSFH